MKKSLFLLLTILFYTACNNIEKSKDRIVAAADQRAILTENLRSLNQRIGGELERWSFYQSEIIKGQETLPQLSSEQQTELNKMLQQFNNYNGTFSAFIQEVNGLAKDFPMQQVELDSMKKAVNFGSKYEGDFKDQVAKVEEANAAIESKLKAWEERLTKMSQEIEANYQQIRSIQGSPIQ